MQPTRRAILDLLKRHGRATLDQLAREIGVVPMTIRAHLAILERDGLVEYHQERGKVGRPRFVYCLTQQAQEHFPKSYEALCNRVLDAVTSPSCAVAPAVLAERIAESWASERLDRVSGKSLRERVHIVAAIRTEEGAMASATETPDGSMIIQQWHCPASCVARRHPDVVCAAEMSYIQRLLGVPIERVSWRLEGADTCSYRIPSVSEPSEPSAT
ncbi:MAG TPA: winged helix-turn-helix transcriptional regulator [Chloroflexota bacterium]|nr:winged helix-turn-helix transcriptional regulator [Chloroflexota bacterium]